MEIAGGKRRPGFQLNTVMQTESAGLHPRASVFSLSTPAAVPPWALATIVLVSALLIFSCCFCLYRKRCRRRMGKKSQAQAQVHLQEVKELGRSYIDKVWPGPAPQPCPLLHPFSSPLPSSLRPCSLPPSPFFAHLALNWTWGPGDEPDIHKNLQSNGDVRRSHRHSQYRAVCATLEAVQGLWEHRAAA